MQTYRINKFVIKKLKNGFFLWTKILIKIETRDKKKFTKKIHWKGGGGSFSGGQFSGGQFSRVQFSGAFFRRAFFPGKFFVEPTAISFTYINLYLIYCNLTNTDDFKSTFT